MNFIKNHFYNISLTKTFFFLLSFSLLITNCEDSEDFTNILFLNDSQDNGGGSGDGGGSGNGGGSGKTYYLNDGFEGSVDRWSTGASSSTAGVWSITDSEANSGSKSATTTPMASEWTYIATSVNTPTYGSVQIKFYYKVVCDNSALVSEFSVYVAGNNSSTQSQLWKRSGGSKDWTGSTTSINLNSIATPPTIRFYAQTVAGSGSCVYYLDDLQVYQ